MEAGHRQRKAYKITKQREKWSDEEHARFVEAIEKFGRDWGKIVAHIGTRTVAQVRSHAQKFFLKLEKAGKADVVPPPRPKKRAAKPYPVQSDKSEERRKSKRFRGSSSVTSSPSETQDATVGPSLTGTASGGRASPRSFQTSLPSGRPMRAARLARAAIIAEMSADLEGEGDGSNVASVHESNAESSGGPSANDYTGVSQSEMDLVPSEGPKQGNSSAPDYNKLFTVVGSVFQSCDEAAHQQMMQQLEPSQRQGSPPELSTASSFTPTLDTSDAHDEALNSLPPWETLAAMMNKLTGNLRNTQPSEHLPGLQQAGSRCSVRAGPPMPGTPQQRAGAACQPPQPSQPSVELDHAPSMALIPSSRSLAVPASLTDEALPTLQPLPGSQGTALLQPLTSPYAAADLQNKLYSDDLEPLQESDSLQNSSSITLADLQHLLPGRSPPKQATDLPLALDLDDAGQGSIAEQLLLNPNPQCMDDELSLDAGPSGGPVMDMPKQAIGEPTESTPLDDCLAQLTSETAPSLRIPGSDDFLDSWKISGNDPVWQSLDLKGSSCGVPFSLKADDSTTFGF